MDKYFEALEEHIFTEQLNFGDGDSILTLLYEAYSDINKMDNDTIKHDFDELYRLMNGMPLREMDKIIYPVCRLCRNHEKSGFIEGIKIGVRLRHELSE